MKFSLVALFAAATALAAPQGFGGGFGGRPSDLPTPTGSGLPFPSGTGFPGFGPRGAVKVARAEGGGGPGGPELPTGVPSGAPSALPTGFPAPPPGAPSGFPSGFPSGAPPKPTGIAY